jgi:hypothetical protein
MGRVGSGHRLYPRPVRFWERLQCLTALGPFHRRLGLVGHAFTVADPQRPQLRLLFKERRQD